MTTTSSHDLRRLGLHRPVVHRDVPYVPTDDAVVTAMLRFAHVTRDDVVYDLGCGDGRIVIAAARQCGARGVGVDIDPLRICESRENAEKARVADRARFHCQSFFDTDLRDATVVMLYLLPSINARLRPKLLSELRPGARIVANYFDGMGDWHADMRADVHNRVLHQWVVPTFVEGAWKCVVNAPDDRHHVVLNLRRRYQVVSGSARVGKKDLPIVNGRLFGDTLTFKLIDVTQKPATTFFSAVVKDHTLRGTWHRDGTGLEKGGQWAGERRA